MRAVGYEHVREHLGLNALAPARPAHVGPVTRVARGRDAIVVPPAVAPAGDDPLLHLLFALKHEGTDLAILMEALPHVPGDRLLQELLDTPSGAYLRILAFLWEHANATTLDGAPPASGAVVPLFDPDAYVTGPSIRNTRWRVDFNGLGTLDYCATVERTEALDAAMASDLPGRINAYAAGLDPVVRDRALAWAYLHETRDSFAIERETPDESRAGAFVALLHQAHDRRDLTEDYLVSLQQATVANPLDRAVAFRHEQNWLQGPLRGAAGVTYVPPPPALVTDLMRELMHFANGSAARIDPIVAAALVSFAFVFVHPFMDGNGRLSRFLFHQMLCRSGALQTGLLLPVSVAMKKHEADYLQALQTFSRPARDRWQVMWIDEGQFDFTYAGDPRYGLYRYWNATAVVAFGYRMAEQALEVELRLETEFLLAYDAVLKQVDARFDVRGSDLATLVVSALANDGAVSKRRRDQFHARVPDAAFDAIEEAVRAIDWRPPAR